MQSFPTLRFGYSRVKLALIGALGAGCAWGLNPFGGPRFVIAGVPAWVDNAFFAVCVALALRNVWLLLGPAKTVVTLTATGLTDRRRGPDEIPWSAIESMRNFRVNGVGQALVLKTVAAPTETALTNFGKCVGVGEINVAAGELNVGFQKFCDTAARYWAAGRHMQPPDRPHPPVEFLSAFSPRPAQAPPRPQIRPKTFAQGFRAGGRV